ncbi:MAG: hypothetical protein ICV72_01515 [Aldersonia sp.]|nr:hypothetical protein [Aldersonia sp.]
MRPTTVLIARWALIAACTLLAFGPAIVRTLDDIDANGLLGYLLVKPLLALTAAIGIARRRKDKVTVYDREVDAIVGGIALALAASFVAFLVPRYAENFLLLRVDLVGFWIFVFGACCLLFGLRAAGAYWPVWLMVMVLAPAPYRVFVTAFGGTWAASSTVLVVDAAIAVGIAVGRSWRRGVAGFAATVILGLVILGVLLLVDAPGGVVQLLPPIAAGAVVSLSFITLTHFTFPSTPLLAQRPSVVVQPRAAIIALVLVSVAFALFPQPHVDTTPDAAPGPASAPANTGQRIPVGWAEDSITHYPWATRYFGRLATLTRQQLTTDDVVPAWDDKGRKRTVVIDTLRTHEPATLIVNPLQTMYDVVTDRRSPVLSVNIGHGVTGSLGTVVDDDLLLTWTELSFDWYRDGAYERVTIISVDNHDPGAQFPQLELSLTGRLAMSLTILLRGSEAATDLRSQYKDRDMLTTLGTALVDAQQEVVIG